MLRITLLGLQWKPIVITCTRPTHQWNFELPWTTFSDCEIFSS